MFEADEMVWHTYRYKTLKLHFKDDSVSAHLNICLPRHGSFVLIECHRFLSSITCLKNMSFHVSKHILFLDFIYGQVHCTLNVQMYSITFLQHSLMVSYVVPGNVSHTVIVSGMSVIL